jgi:hypothetical protein
MDFQALREKNPHLSKRIDAWEKTVRLSEIALETQNNPIIEEILRGLHESIEFINSKLITDEKMTQEERLIFFARRECYQWVMDKFTGTIEAGKSLEKNLRRKYE